MNILKKIQEYACRLPAHLNSSTARHRSAHCRRTGSLSAPAACRHTPVFFSKYSIDHLILLSVETQPEAGDVIALPPTSETDIAQPKTEEAAGTFLEEKTDRL